MSRSGSTIVKDLARATGFSERHVRYRLQAARILGFVGEDDQTLVLTPTGRDLLRTAEGSAEEKEHFRRAVGSCSIIRELAPNLLVGPEINLEMTAKRIAVRSGLSQATADRRAVVLRAWQKFLA